MKFMLFVEMKGHTDLLTSYVASLLKMGLFATLSEKQSLSYLYTIFTRRAGESWKNNGCENLIFGVLK